MNDMVNCPKCSSLIRKVKLRKIKHPSKAILDVCDSCGGMWLDKAEVRLLSKYRGGKEK